MSLQLAAQHLASKGRGPDTQLVHMAPSEVAGLQALARAAGGTLTVNPDTGLPEAGFLEKMLPALIGVGLMAATGGAAAPGLFGLGMPATIGLGVGGVEALRTGNLSKGLMAGLGAYGGAGLGAGLLGAGAAGAGAAGAGAGAAGAGAGSAALDVLGQPMTGMAQAAGQGFTQNLAQMGQGIGALASGTPGAGSAAMGAMGGGGMNAARMGLAAASPALMAKPKQAEGPQDEPNPYKFKYEYERPEDPYSTSSREAMQYRGRYVPYATGGTVEEMSAANGALMREQEANVPGYAMGGVFKKIKEYLDGQGGGDSFTFDPATQTYTRTGGSGPGSFSYDQATGQYKEMAAGGLSHLGDYSDGGRLLKGPGDGVSDSIPAVIADKRPARLADGEFVVPARIVSELGNGSTDAGARKLYAMMDRIQQNRAKTVGKNKVAVNSRSDKHLPA